MILLKNGENLAGVQGFEGVQVVPQTCDPQGIDFNAKNEPRDLVRNLSGPRKYCYCVRACVQNVYKFVSNIVRNILFVQHFFVVWFEDRLSHRTREKSP